MEARYIEIRERLKNLHYFYRMRLDEEKNKSVERNLFFLAMIEDLQKSHGAEIEHYKKLLRDVDGEHKDIGNVDDRMVVIKSSVDEILRKSSAFKSSNEELD